MLRALLAIPIEQGKTWLCANHVALVAPTILARTAAARS